MPSVAAERPREVDVPPARLGCRGDEAEGGRRGREVDGAERPDADPGQRAEARLRVAEERQRLADRLRGAGRGQPRSRRARRPGPCPRRRRTWFPRLRRPRRAVRARGSSPHRPQLVEPDRRRHRLPRAQDLQAVERPRGVDALGDDRLAVVREHLEARAVEEDAQRSRGRRASAGGPACRPGYSSWNGVARERRRSTNTRSGSCATPTTTSSPGRSRGAARPRSTPRARPRARCRRNPAGARSGHERRVALRPQGCELGHGRLHEAQALGQAAQRERAGTDCSPRQGEVGSSLA